MSDATKPLEPQLHQWALAYGGEQFGRLGYASQEKLASATTASGVQAADRIETIVRRMEAQGRWKEARVLRAEVFLEGVPEAERLQRLHRSGVMIGRSAYYAYLRSACLFVEGALSGVDLHGEAANGP
jgi:hypothetical protein